jgi:hypothetical protein
MVRIRSSQKFFTEEEAINLTGICAEHLRGLAATKHLGSMAVAADSTVRKWLFTISDLMIMAVLHPRCEH